MSFNRKFQKIFMTFF